MDISLEAENSRYRLGVVLDYLQVLQTQGAITQETYKLMYDDIYQSLRFALDLLDLNDQKRIKIK